MRTDRNGGSPTYLDAVARTLLLRKPTGGRSESPDEQVDAHTAGGLELSERKHWRLQHQPDRGEY